MAAAKSAHGVRRSRPAASGWIVLRVVVQRQGGEEFSQPPGRDLLIHGSHSFAEVAAAIDRAFARWDLSHLHEFRMADGRRVGTVDDEFGGGDNELDERMESVAKAV